MLGDDDFGFPLTNITFCLNSLGNVPFTRPFLLLDSVTVDNHFIIILHIKYSINVLTYII